MLIKMPLFSISTLVRCHKFYALDMVRRILLLIQLCMSTCIQIKTYFLLTGVCVETVAPCPRSRKMSAVQRQHRQYLHTQRENQFVLIMVYFILILCDTVAFIVCNTLQVTRRLLEVEGNLKWNLRWWTILDWSLYASMYTRSRMHVKFTGRTMVLCG